jgi:hypothetical protein
MPAFNAAVLAGVPRASGVFKLERAGRTMYIGMALELRATLEQHLYGAHGECTRTASSFEFQATDAPVAVQRQWLAQFGAANGGALPECNERSRAQPPR